MTGYGTDQVQIDDTLITVEVKTINHRFLDFNPKIPRSMLFLEEQIKKIIQSYFSRGKIEVYIQIEGENLAQRRLVTDWNLMDQYVRQLKEIQDRYNLSGEIPISMINAIPELLSVQEREQNHRKLEEAILNSIDMACAQVLQRRIEEGSFLIKDIKERVNSIRNMVLLLKERRAVVIEEYRMRINNRIDEYVGDSVMIDSSRMHQEIALLAEKGDITEEITRLLSHIDHFESIANEKDAIGRKMDFILQEMHRETNTVGSKSSDSQIGEWTVSLKSEIEKIKEQIQNIE